MELLVRVNADGHTLVPVTYNPMVGEPAVRTIRMRDDLIEGGAGRDGATSAVAAGRTVHLARVAGRSRQLAEGSRRDPREGQNHDLPLVPERRVPSGVDVAPFLPAAKKPVIVVPRYRLEAWQAGAKMPPLPPLFYTKTLDYYSFRLPSR